MKYTPIFTLDTWSLKIAEPRADCNSYTFETEHQGNIVLLNKIANLILYTDGSDGLAKQVIAYLL